MKIKNGYNNKPLEIIIQKSSSVSTADIYIEEKGLKKTPSQTISIATIEELMELRNNINEVLKQIIGVKP